MKLETLAIHAGQSPDATTGAVTQPIHLSTTFEREADGSFPSSYVYTRSGNPNRKALETLLTRLEHGVACAAFSSGSAAAGSIFRALRPGDHAIIPDDMYWGIRKLLLEVFVPWGLEISQVDMSDTTNVEAAIKPNTRLIWIETPSNPMLKITDIAAVTKLAKQVGAKVACDNTWTPPGMQNVFELGGDLILHATTKYLSGHSDVLGGAVITKEDDEFWQRVVFIQQSEGAVPSPFDCWLTMRGIKTLAYRIRGHVENASHLAKWLNSHPKIEKVFYPGLSTHPNQAIARRQMTSFGGMLSFLVKGGEAKTMKVAGKLQLITRATSLGGVESLIEHRASIEGPTSLTPKNLLRFSVGLEHVDDLVADLEQALG